MCSVFMQNCKGGKYQNDKEAMGLEGGGGEWGDGKGRGYRGAGAEGGEVGLGRGNGEGRGGEIEEGRKKE